MYEITLLDLFIAFIPVCITLVIVCGWSDNFKSASIALVRMLLQLLMIGYALEFIFNAKNGGLVLMVLSVMLVAASWIALAPVPVKKGKLFLLSLAAVAGGGVLILLVISQAVLHASPWYQPSVMIPIAGMIFSNAMNSVSLAGERFYSEMGYHQDDRKAKQAAYQAALIPVINSLLAVGLVALPGMMTGQILAGTSPLVAVRYQMVVMCMMFSSAGISAAIFLWLLGRRHRLLLAPPRG